MKLKYDKHYYGSNGFSNTAHGELVITDFPLLNQPVLGFHALLDTVSNVLKNHHKKLYLRINRSRNWLIHVYTFSDVGRENIVRAVSADKQYCYQQAMNQLVEWLVNFTINQGGRENG